MIRERRYRGGSRGRSPSPRRPPLRSRDFSPPGHWKLSPNRRRGSDEHLREAKTSQRIEKMDHFDDRAPRFDCRDRDRFDGRTFRSPRRIEERVTVDRPMSLSNYGDGTKGKYVHEISVGNSERSYIEDSYRGDLCSSLKPYHLSVKNYSPARGSSGVGDINLSSCGDRDYYLQNPFLDSSQAEFPVSRYLDSTKPLTSNYPSAEKLHSHSYSLARGRVDDIPVFNGGARSSHMRLNTEADKDQHFRVWNEPRLEKNNVLHERGDNYFEKKSTGLHFQDMYVGVGKSVERDIYKSKEEDNLLSSRGYLKDDSDYMVLSSQIKDYNLVPLAISRGCSGYSPSRELHIPSSDVIQRGSGMASQPIGYDGYSEMKQNLLSTEHGGQFDDTRSRSRVYVELPEERQGDWQYAEFGRRKIDITSRSVSNVEDDYRHKHLLRTDVLKHNVDARSHEKHMEYDGRRNQYSSLHAPTNPNKFDSLGSDHVRREDVDTLGNGSTRLNYGAEGYYGYGGVRTEKNHTNDGQWSHFENSDPLQSQGYDPTFGRLYSSPRKRLPTANSNLSEPCRRSLGYGHVTDDMFYEHDAGIRISTDGNGARRIYNQADVDDETDFAYSSKKPKSSRHDYEYTWRMSSKLGSDEPSSSEFHPRHSTKPHKSSSRDIKKRLGPIQKLHVSERLVKKNKPSIKKRLAHAPRNRHASLPWIKNKSSGNIMSEQKDPDGAVRGHDGDHLRDRLPLAKPEPSEKSEEFKQLVQNAFFKFLKQISETPTKRKMYMEQGNAGIVTCFLCSSNSQEFVGTEGLAMHAFTSKTVPLRSQHLGLHKALCALMGWKHAKHPSSEWHVEAMTAAETQVSREDLIIWPPLVVVHNSTIDSTSPAERVIISTKKLDSKIRDMGFGSILKVCNGKPANQSVMLVKFNGTLSGLQEAQRFHQNYVESKHGRPELDLLKSKGESSRGGSKSKSSGTEDDFLYGYMGVAEDLDKLDFDTKKRCVLRSKKQILSIVDVPINT